MRLLLVIFFLSPFAAHAADALPPIRSHAEMQSAFARLTTGDYKDSAEYARLLDQLKPYIDRHAPEQRRLWEVHDCWRDDPRTKQEFDRQFEKTERYLTEAESAGDRKAVADLLMCRSWYRSEAGLTDDALLDAERAVSIARRLGDDRLLADALSSRGELRAYLGDLALGLRDLQEAQSLYDKLNLAYWSRANLTSIANTYRKLGFHDKALEYFQQVIDRAKAAGEDGEVMEVKSQIALVYEETGKLNEAHALFDDILSEAIKEGDKATEAIARMNIASVLTLLGKPAEALEHLKFPQAFFADSPDKGSLSILHLTLGRALLGTNQLNEARDALLKARQFAEQEKNQRYLAWTLSALAEADQRLGQWETAYKELSRYIDVLNDLNTKMQQQQTIYAQTEFDVVRKEKENIRLAAQAALQQQQLATLEERRKWQWTITLLSAFLALLLVIQLRKQAKRGKELHLLSITDPLTGLPNHRRIFELGEKFISDAARKHVPFSILVFDIDHFKRVNDTYGHPAGDEVLKRMAAIALEALRIEDVVGRTGGEEFMVLLPGTNLSQARAVAERLRIHVARATFSDVAPNLSVTISIGVAQWKSRPETFHNLYECADDALYEAKNNGRDCVVTSR